MTLGRAYPGGMQISYNGEVVGDASTLNFVSAAGEISVSYDSEDSSQINAYHPGATFASNWTQNDGIFGSGVVPLTPISTRLVSTPTSEGTPFSTGGAAGTLSATSRTATVSFAPVGDIRFGDLTSTFTVTVSVAGTQLFSETTGVIITNGSLALPNLGSVNITGFAANVSEYKGKVSVSIPIGVLVPNSGAVQVVIQHNNGANNNQFSQSFFYDSETNTASQGVPTLALNTPVVKLTSGVSALTTDTTWDITVPDLDFIFSDTAPASILNLSTATLGVASSVVNYSTFGTTAFDVENLAHNATLSLDVMGIASCGAVSFTSALNDWSQVSSVTSNTLQALILTKAASSALVETFGDEVYRVSSALGSWDSSLVIGNGDLVVACGKLQRRGVNYSTFLPHGSNAIVNPDYSLAGDAAQTFYRTFSDLGTSRQNGTLVLTGLASESGIQVEFSTNGTDWFNILDGYVGGTLQPGQGAKVGGTGDTFNFTLSTHNTVATGLITVRITMTTAHELTGLTLTWT